MAIDDMVVVKRTEKRSQDRPNIELSSRPGPSLVNQSHLERELRTVSVVQHVHVVEMLCDLYTGFEPSQLSCLSSLVGKSVAWRADGRGFESHSARGSQFFFENDCFGHVVLCCFAFLLCCCCCLAFLSISYSDCSCTLFKDANITTCIAH